MELRRTVFSSIFELRGTDTTSRAYHFQVSNQRTVRTPIWETGDYHFVKRVAGDPHPVLLGPLEQLRQVRLQTIQTSILLSIDAVKELRAKLRC